MVEETSVKAFKEIQELIGVRQAMVYGALSGSLQGLTDQEVKEKLGFEDPNAVRPRRKDLLDLGLVESHGRRVCSVTGRTAMVWRVVEPLDFLRVVQSKKLSRKREKVCPLCGGKGMITLGQKIIKQYEVGVL